MSNVLNANIARKKHRTLVITITIAKQLILLFGNTHPMKCKLQIVHSNFLGKRVLNSQVEQCFSFNRTFSAANHVCNFGLSSHTRKDGNLNKIIQLLKCKLLCIQNKSKENHSVFKAHGQNKNYNKEIFMYLMLT